jgi:hypothetical protein
MDLESAELWAERRVKGDAENVNVPYPLLRGGLRKERAQVTGFIFREAPKDLRALPSRKGWGVGAAGFS